MGAPTEATTTTQPTTTSYIPPDAKCKHGGINDHEDPKDCIHFYICTLKEDGTWDALLQKCDKATVFNPEISTCDFPENVPVKLSGWGRCPSPWCCMASRM